MPVHFRIYMLCIQYRRLSHLNEKLNLTTRVRFVNQYQYTSIVFFPINVMYIGVLFHSRLITSFRFLMKSPPLVVFMVRLQQQLHALLGDLHYRELSRSYLHCNIFSLHITTINHLYCTVCIFHKIFHEIVVKNHNSQSMVLYSTSKTLKLIISMPR